MINRGLKYYTEPDQIGTTLGMTNTSQSQVYSVEYDAFGDIVDTTGSFTDTYAFVDGYAGTNGYQTDRDTGFIRCGNRFYSPYFGRFITRDPAKSGMNWYDYCGNDPTGRTDASGKYSSSDLAGSYFGPNNGGSATLFAQNGQILGYAQSTADGTSWNLNYTDGSESETGTMNSNGTNWSGWQQYNDPNTANITDVTGQTPQALASAVGIPLSAATGFLPEGAAAGVAGAVGIAEDSAAAGTITDTTKLMYGVGMSQSLVYGFSEGEEKPSSDSISIDTIEEQILGPLIDGLQDAVSGF